MIGVMQIAEANRISLVALRAVLGAAHPFDLSIGGKAIHVSPRAPQAGRWPKGPEGLDEQKDGPWPSSVLLDCEWTGGRVTLEMRASVWRGSNRYNGMLALQVVTSPLNREILWTTLAQRILTTEQSPVCTVPVTLTLFAREGEQDTRHVLASLIEQTRAIGLEQLSQAMFRLFDIALADTSVRPAPPDAFERVVRAALVKLPYVVRGEESDVTGALFIDIGRLLPSPPPAKPEAPLPPGKAALPEPPIPTEPAAAAVEVSTQENVFFDAISFDNLASFKHFAWPSIARLNVIVGANDTGKSHLLKLLYVLARSVQEFTARIESDRPPWVEVLAEKLVWTFQPPGSRLGELVRREVNGEPLNIVATLCNETYSFGVRRSAGRAASDIMNVTEDIRPQPGLRALFIPPKEVLTSLDAIAAVREQLKRFGFDDTYYDLVVALRGEPIQVELPAEFQRVLSNLEELLTGHIETERGRFVFKRAGEQFDMPQVAEGIKKIGIFTRLIQNGSLRRNSILFIDEPETNLHPRAARALVRMLYDLSQAGVQIYIATHSYFVLKQFELIARKHETPVQLCCLSREGGAITSSFFDLQDGMPENGIVEESLSLYDEDVDVGMGS